MPVMALADLTLMFRFSDCNRVPFTNSAFIAKVHVNRLRSQVLASCDRSILFSVELFWSGIWRLGLGNSRMNARIDLFMVLMMCAEAKLCIWKIFLLVANSFESTTTDV